MKRIEVLSVASEVFPLVKTGGLADVAGALPKALAPAGIAMRTLLPLYPAVAAKVPTATVAHRFDNLMGGPAHVLAAKFADLDLLLLDAPHLFDRPGSLYTGPDGADWPDNGLRFAALAQAGAALALGIAGYRPDIVHCHDWQAGLLPAYLHYAGVPGPRTIMTVHNLAFQGQYPYELLAKIGLPPAAYVYDGVEYYGTIGYLKAGLQLADRITTVSPTYAQEIRDPEAGMGLAGLIEARAGDLVGIINGIDTKAWNPARDAALTAPYSADHPAPRALNKAALQARMGLDAEPETLTYGIISRLSWQKGLDLVLDVMGRLVDSGAMLAVLGAGDPHLEEAFRTAARRTPGRVACTFGYDEGLAHQIQAGVDALLVPSRFEPCGLTQLCALRYGAVPVVARVGGLADTVIDANEMALSCGVATGIQFAPVTAEALAAALTKTAGLYANTDEWQLIQANGMNTDVSWSGPARRYARLYRSLLSDA